MQSIDYALAHQESSGADSNHQRSDILLEIKAYLDEYYWRQISISDLGSMTDLSPSYLNKLFQQRFGISLHNYITELRFERALKLLTEKEKLPIRKVAESVGITDQRYFSRCFKERYGVSPGEYQRLNSAQD
jgi:two-component system response regulator YesN